MVLAGGGLLHGDLLPERVELPLVSFPPRPLRLVQRRNLHDLVARSSDRPHHNVHLFDDGGVLLGGIGRLADLRSQSARDLLDVLPPLPPVTLWNRKEALAVVGVRDALHLVEPGQGQLLGLDVLQRPEVQPVLEDVLKRARVGLHGKPLPRRVEVGSGDHPEDWRKRGAVRAVHEGVHQALPPAVLVQLLVLVHTAGDHLVLDDLPSEKGVLRTAEPLPGLRGLLTRPWERAHLPHLDLDESVL
mmetsp:Transcript_1774/g.5996  ORF Transcript_1774/g.5996 Transcript_1774/m.5996 type:complete len:245 (-) Transcript_1774:960-1694(-)